MSAVTSEIDGNIQSQNIKNGVTILGVTGNYSGTTPTLITKNITQNGTYNASSDSADGYSQVTVNVSGGGGGGLSRNYIVDGRGTLIPDPNNGFMGLGGATDVCGYAFARAYVENYNVTGTLDLSSLEKVSGEYAFYRAFMNCTNISNIDFSSLEKIDGEYAFYEAFAYCYDISGTIDLSSLLFVFGGETLCNMFYCCENITNVDLSNLQYIGDSSCGGMLAECTSLETVDLSNLYYIRPYGLSSTFVSTPELSSVSFDSLFLIDSYGLSWSFVYSGLQEIRFPKLAIIYDGGLNGAFSGGNVQHIYFPALADYSIRSTNVFGTNFLGSEDDGRIDGCTIHFPSNFDPELANPSYDITTLDSYPNFGGTNTVLAFDLPATTDGYLDCNISNFCKDNQYSYALQYVYGLSEVHFSEMTRAPIEFGSVFYWMFNGCSDLHSVNFDVLTEEDLSDGTYVFNNLLSNCSNVTVHFPSNLQYIMASWPDVISGFGGANTTVLFDLPSTE